MIIGSGSICAHTKKRERETHIQSQAIERQRRNRLISEKIQLCFFLSLSFVISIFRYSLTTIFLFFLLAVYSQNQLKLIIFHPKKKDRNFHDFGSNTLKIFLFALQTMAATVLFIFLFVSALLCMCVSSFSESSVAGFRVFVHVCARTSVFSSSCHYGSIDAHS